MTGFGELFARINARRLWVLLTAIWFLAVAGYYWNDIARQYNASIRAKADADARERETRFHECLRNAGTTWFAVVERYGEECAQYVREECKGSLWCADEFLRDICLKGKSAECRHIYLVSEFPEDSFGWTKTRGDIVFYLSTRYSDPLVNALLLAVAVPAALAFVPRLSLALWRWLTGH